jgi:hypothetical protein
LRKTCRGGKQGQTKSHGSESGISFAKGQAACGQGPHNV